MEMNRKNTIRRVIDEIFNQGKLDTADELMHPEYTYNSPTESMHGTTEFKCFVRALRIAFPDLRLRIEELLAEGQTTSLRFVLTGTHQGDFFGVPATGRAVEVGGVVLSHFKGNRIRREYEILDNQTLFQQLGLAAA